MSDNASVPLSVFIVLSSNGQLILFITMLYVLVIVLAAELGQTIYTLRTIVLKRRAVMAEEMPILLGDMDELGKDTVYRLTIPIQDQGERTTEENANAKDFRPSEVVIEASDEPDPSKGSKNDDQRSPAGRTKNFRSLLSGNLKSTTKQP